MAKRLLQLVIVFASLGAVLLGVELACFGAERAAARWTWPTPRHEELAFDPQVGFRRRGDAAPSVEPDATLVVLSNRLLGALARPRDRRDALVRLLAERGVLAMEPRFADVPWANTTQQALDVELPPRAIAVLAIGAEDVAANARTTLAGHALPVLAEQRGQMSRAGLTAPQPTPPPALEDASEVIPTLRFLLRPVARVSLGAKPGLLPAELWPYRRGGTSDETRRWDPTRRALALLRDRVARADGRLLVVWVPAPIEVDNDSASALLAELQLDPEDVEVSRAARRLRDECAALDIAHCDPSRAMRRIRDPAERPLFEPPPDQRAALTARGRGLVLRTVAEATRRLVTSQR